MKREVTVKQYISGTITSKTDFVVQEDEITLLINQTDKLLVSMSPEDLHPFVYGFLLTSGLITVVDQVLSVTRQGSTLHIQLSQPIPDFRLVLSSGCGSSGTMDSERPIAAHAEILLPDLEHLPTLFSQFNHLSDVFEDTGGIHSAAITNGQSILFFAEDIGRHNAVDKVIGKALLQSLPLHQHFLLTSGRISGEIIKKVAYAGLRAVISRSAPTCAAIKRARRANIGIIGFLRGKRFNLYS